MHICSQRRPTHRALSRPEARRERAKRARSLCMFALKGEQCTGLRCTRKRDASERAKQASTPCISAPKGVQNIVSCCAHKRSTSERSERVRHAYMHPKSCSTQIPVAPASECTMRTCTQRHTAHWSLLRPKGNHERAKQGSASCMCAPKGVLHTGS